ncbi:hypothetical protein H072_2247 [Dactylellina haptotyla CBS 200.50]|uniref:tyrosinase n=1 Tax=Dactylellina haptotyla (strain CBS 200.50) TaxID=1284197 RepID=S8ARX9_DACHA|nr:hypothetical protein H072_2247 [Dactylellina haptotyla CBS 200.50]
MTEPNNLADPVWENEIKDFFANPYWVCGEIERKKLGEKWTKKMHVGEKKDSYNFGINLADHASVTEWSRQIYLQVKSGNMPMTEHKHTLFPKAAVERFYLWMTQGHRKTHRDPIVATEVKIPTYQPPPFKVRKDISTLTQTELDAYRAAIDDALDPTSLKSKWQELCYIHTNWCLHYQEAFLPWHRAHLMYMEFLIGCAIPYWNWMAKDAADPTSDSSGIPQAFFDETYEHPTKGKRPNPLKFALAKDGKSADGDDKSCATRAKELVPGSVSEHDRGEYIKKMSLYQVQIVNALKLESFSIPQDYLGSAGYPWANIPTFSPPQPLHDYIYDFKEDPIDEHFDNMLEQPHDNFHGWLGPDMADNSYTAFDPVFWSFHANMDRVFEMWIRDHPNAKYTYNFPLRPFVGAHANNITISEGDPRAWIHTTLGDMARDCKKLGYIFMPPRVPDLKIGTKDQLSALGGAKEMVLLGAPPPSDVSADSATETQRGHQKAYVVFDGVRCTDETFVIDVFLKAKSTAALTGSQLASNLTNPYFVGTSTRIGMGDAVSADSKGQRCIKQGVERPLLVTLIPAEIEHLSVEEVEVVLKVTNLTQGVEVAKDVYSKISGFTGKFCWDAPVRGTAAEGSEQAKQCCSSDKV